MGAVLPTSASVANAIADVLPHTGTPTIVELGPGTGPLSDAIRDRTSDRAQHIAIELDPAMAAYLRETKPWLHVIEGDAANLRSLLDTAGVTEVDAVVSSIPWTLLPPAKQRAVLHAVADTLRPDGVFTAITYLTTLWRSNTTRFIRTLHEAFGEVLPRSAVWRNVPPARVYVCRQPIIGRRDQ